jgi:hypothetical protein
MIDVITERKIIPEGKTNKAEQHWKLSPYGERMMTQKLAIKK